MKSILLFFALILFSNGYSQEKLINYTSEVNDIVEQYNKELALTGVQLPLFKKTVADYLNLKKNIVNEYKGTEELDMLYNLRKKELNNMSHVLDEKQLK